MRVKVFTAATMQEAMTQVKAELGIDAVILHTRRFHKGGFLGYMGKEVVEVTAAVEDAPKRSAPEFTMKEPIVPQAVVKQYATLPPLSSAPLAREAPVQVDEKIIEPKETDMYAESLEEDEPEIAIAVETSLEEVQAQKIDELQRQINQMKIILEKVMSEPGEQVKTISLYEALTEHEVMESVAQEIVRQVEDDAVLADKNARGALDFLTTYFDRMTHPASGIEMSGEATKIVAFIGATGVGKTTTIAKVAANFVLEEGISVALITADTYRISAMEQLKTYSDIIGLPIEIVYTPDELRCAVDKHSDKQLILIDTAGRSQHNEFQIAELKELLLAVPGIEKHLVLSATTKYKDARDIIRNFSVCTPDKILFTKVDETSSIGLIVNLIHQYPISLSYITNGQSVPDDIVVADSHQLAELILR